jgi:hypothetical protein
MTPVELEEVVNPLENEVYLANPKPGQTNFSLFISYEREIHLKPLIQLGQVVNHLSKLLFTVGSSQKSKI